MDENERAKVVTQLEEIAEKGRAMRAALRTLDLEAVIAAGQLIPKGSGWYEVTGNIHTLPAGVGYLIEELGVGDNKRPRIRLAKLAPLLGTLEEF